ncbi:MAG: SprB repeat-containing protein, partial [Bacteroidetes bacterium]|nr:SprB repeat-containing protein [Bacteroidota bacterium]
ARDIFIIKFTNTGVRLWATYFGGDGDDFREPLAADKLSNLFVAGEWTNETGALLTDSSYPLTDPGGGAYYDTTFNGITSYDDDGFVAKFIPSVLTLTSAAVSASCGCNGLATTTPSGGCQPYKYSWYNIGWTQVGNTQAISSLCSGNYQVIVNDTVNCVNDTDFVNVPSGVGLALNGTQTDLLCNGVTNGTASITISNGSGPYTYAWSNGQATQTATGLAAGSYTITVSDANSCSSTAVFVITSPLPLIGEFTKGTAICNGCGCKQWIMIGATGGISPYTYSWPDGYINRYKNNLCPGSYSVNISDTNGCSININLSTP